MTVINKTPHDVVILNDNNKVDKIYVKSTEPIRLQSSIVRDEPLPDGTPTCRTVFGEPEGLPDYKEGVYYIV